MNRETELKAVFDSYDKDGDGVLQGAEELKAALSDAKHTVTDEELEQIVAYADENGNGQLSFDEFSNFIK
jgi:Ca2+-binding EF-hand superfamily protein